MAHSKNGELQAAAKSFPTLIEGAQHLYHCGYHSESSFGAASYFVERQDGNILVDSPRFDKSLLKNIKVGPLIFANNSTRLANIAGRKTWRQRLCILAEAESII